jgi:hypothetical protein
MLCVHRIVLFVCLCWCAGINLTSDAEANQTNGDVNDRNLETRRTETTNIYIYANSIDQLNINAPSPGATLKEFDGGSCYTVCVASSGLRTFSDRPSSELGALSETIVKNLGEVSLSGGVPQQASD